jgi:hypothetical protein
MAPSVVWDRKRERELRVKPTSRSRGSLLLAQQPFLVHRMTGQLGTLCRGVSEDRQFPFRTAVPWKAAFDAEAVFQVEEHPTAISSDPCERGYARPFGEPSPRGRCPPERFPLAALPHGRKGNAT